MIPYRTLQRNYNLYNPPHTPHTEYNFNTEKGGQQQWMILRLRHRFRCYLSACLTSSDNVRGGGLCRSKKKKRILVLSFAWHAARQSEGQREEIKQIFQKRGEMGTQAGRYLPTYVPSHESTYLGTSVHTNQNIVLCLINTFLALQHNTHST